MSNVKTKKYDDTFLFSLPGEMLKHHNHISDFIIRSNRIENKRADNFRGVVEDVKRYQKSAILHHMLMRDDVVLCYNEVEMPPAFKVFLAKDSKANGAKRVFIDVSGIIDFKNGSYYCKNIQRLITYLFQAITWLLYEYEPEALLNNSNITLAATDCFVKMFDYILGYFRFYGFNDNRTKIDYLIALYFMITILGKDDDQYTNQVAAKLTGVEQSLTKSYALYYEKEDLDNIDTFINLLANTFKLKGLTTEVFISRWISNCGIGTQFAPELFTAFSNMMIGAYCGAYIVNQKVIEKQCAQSMIQFSTNILKLGSSQLDRGKLFENAVSDEEEHIPDLVTKELQEAVKARSNKPEKTNYTKATCKSKADTTDTIKAIVKYYKSSQQLDKIAPKAVAFAKMAIGCMSTTKNKEDYEIGVLSTTISNTKDYIKVSKYKYDMVNIISKAMEVQQENIEKYRLTDKSLTKVLTAQYKELVGCKNMLQ